MTRLQSHSQQAQTKASNPLTSAWVAASAGTGKTKVLTDRLLKLLLAGTDPHRILCITFTKAASAEMANRLYEKLSFWTQLSDEALRQDLKGLYGRDVSPNLSKKARTLFSHVLDAPGGLKILTIHGFCQSLLKRFPLEAEVSTHFDVLDEQATTELRERAFYEVLDRTPFSPEEQEAFNLCVLYYTPKTLLSLLKDLQTLKVYPKSEEVYRVLKTEKGLSQSDIVAYACGEDQIDVPALSQAVAWLKTGSKTDQERGEKISQWVNAPQKCREESFETYATAYLTSTNSIRKRLCTTALEKKYPPLFKNLHQEAQRLEAVSQKQKSLKIAQMTDAFFMLGSLVADRYTQLKNQQGVLDYDDLIDKAVHLLERKDVAPWVLYKLDGGLDHILVDEAQDTSPAQWKVIATLTEEFFQNTEEEDTPRTLFVVGDTKQSIYSFQGADPQVFSLMKEQFQIASANQRLRWEEVEMTTSFRSAPAVLEVVDRVFERESLKKSLLHTNTSIQHQAFRYNHSGRVELWPLIEPEKEKKSADAWEPPIRFHDTQKDPALEMARRVAQRINTLLSQKILLKSKGRPIQASDILILVQRRGEFVPKLIQALKRQNIPVAGSDRMILNDQLVVKDLLILGEFLLLPQDDLALATVLKSPLFNLTEEDLYDLCIDRAGSLWEQLLKSKKHQTCTKKLQHLLHLKDAIRPFELYMEVLVGLKGKSAFVRRLGAECLDPMEEFLNQLLVFEQTHVPTLQNFIQHMQSVPLEIKRDFEQGIRDEVRVMTVHGAKGLQAPIVILPDTVRTPTQRGAFLDQEGDSPLWSPPQALDIPLTKALKEKARAKEMDEYWRLLYVALTRAEDHLYVCGWTPKSVTSKETWYGVLQETLEKMAESQRLAFGSQTTMPCLVYETNPMQEGAPTNPKPERESPVEDLPPWVLKPIQKQEKPFKWANPSQGVPSKQTRKSFNTTANPEGQSEYLALRGTLIHKLLETIPDTYDLSQMRTVQQNSELITDIRGFLSLPLQGLTADQIDEIQAHTLRVLDSSAFQALLGSGSFAEIPVVGVHKETAYSGQIDRLVEKDQEVWLIDYKTNQSPPSSLEGVPDAYIQQLKIYAVLVESLYPSKTIRPFLFWTETLELMEV